MSINIVHETKPRQHLTPHCPVCSTRMTRQPRAGIPYWCCPACANVLDLSLPNPPEPPVYNRPPEVIL